MALVRSNRRPMASPIQRLGECRRGVELGKIADDTQRHLVQLEQDEASRSGHSLTSALDGSALEEPNHFGSLFRTLPLVPAATIAAWRSWWRSSLAILSA